MLMNARLLAVLIGGLLLVFAGCKTFTDVHSGSTKQIAKGEQFEVVLDANPTTGYQWKLVEYDPNVIRPVGSPKFTPQGGGMIGSGGKEYYVFKAVGPGKTTLVMHYQRPWERDQDPARTYELTVEVK